MNLSHLPVLILWLTIGCFMNNPTFARMTSQGDWEKIRFGVGISTLIKQEE